MQFETNISMENCGDDYKITRIKLGLKNVLMIILYIYQQKKNVFMIVQVNYLINMIINVLLIVNKLINNILVLKMNVRLKLNVKKLV